MSVSVTLWRVGAVTFTEDQIRLIAVLEFSTIASPITVSKFSCSLATESHADQLSPMFQNLVFLTSLSNLKFFVAY